MLVRREKPMSEDNSGSPIAPSKEEIVIADGPQHLENKSEVPLTVTPVMRRRAWVQFAALCFTIYVAGWNDGTLGPLLPRLQEVYHVGYTVVSLIFVTNCMGSFIGAATYLYLTDRFGYGLVSHLASLILAIGNSLQASGSPFPVFVVAYLFAGYSNAFLDAGSNAFVASVAGDTSTKMGIMHAIYGVGAMCAPLVSTQFARLPRWSFVYLVHIGLVTLSAVSQMLTFRFRRQNDLLAEIGQPPPEKTQDSEAGMSKFKQVLRLRAVHLMAFFIFTYVGVEVTVSGWIITYIINERHGGANSGYISSGFWGGLTLGRVALLWLNKKVGERRVVFIYILAVVGLELVVWLVPNLYAGAVSVCFVGFFLGPIYPILMNHCGRVLPPELISGAIGWIACWGAAGAAVFPFVTGAIASKAGIVSLLPVLVSMMGLLFTVWLCVPNSRC
ncbi:MFS general substrate transporter [Lentinus tigrinus ALCF2SS1-6]|uniref:MFS general substrate transporter n=1 Tax=Lentinus tigrinus ALCF2SS1-6 TaxID=1328759 RepID=A0A5C2SDU6_9APHY|nr:MFS general substrate transporter [Lentinus tigrinus ALCF2SS1-6]